VTLFNSVYVAGVVRDCFVDTRNDKKNGFYRCCSRMTE